MALLAWRTVPVISAQPSPGLHWAVAGGWEPRRNYVAPQIALHAVRLFRDRTRATFCAQLV